MMYTSTMRGSVLGTVIMVVGLAFLAALVVAGASTFHLQAAQRITNSQTASNLAESAIHQAIAQLQVDPESRPEVDITRPDGSFGRVTFNRTAPVFSTNNFTGSTPQGWRRSVPISTVHVVGVGRCNGVDRRIETLVHLPTFPTAIAVSGPLTVRNTLVAGVEDGAVTMSGGQVTYDRDDLKPGDVATNNDDPAQSLVLEEATIVKGNAQARGGVVRTGTAVVEGEVRSPWTEFAEMPDLTVADYDPRSRYDIYYETLDAPVYPSRHLTGVWLSDGNLRIDGPLTLDNTVLFVAGDLRVEGGLSGTGAVFVTGSVDLRGGVTLVTDESVALLAEGNVRIWGDDRLRNVFQGVVYSRGSVTIERVTLVGSFVQDSDNPALTTTVIDSNLFYSAAGASPKFVWPVQLTTQTLFPPPPEAITGGETTLAVDGVSSSARDPRAGQIPFLPPLTPGTVFAEPPTGPGANRWLSSDVGLIEARMENDQMVFSWRWWGRDTDFNPLRNPDGSPLISEVIYASEQEFLSRFPNDLIYGYGGSGGYTEFSDDGIVPTVTQVRAQLVNAIERTKAVMNAPGGSWGVYISFDPNEFLARDETVRLLMWNEL